MVCTYARRYEVRLTEGLECGGAYLKMLDATKDFDPKQLDSASPYIIMFGPDKCGGTNKVLPFLRVYKYTIDCGASAVSVYALELYDGSAVTTSCVKGLALLQAWNAGDMSPSGRSRRSVPQAAALVVWVHARNLFNSVYHGRNILRFLVALHGLVLLLLATTVK